MSVVFSLDMEDFKTNEMLYRISKYGSISKLDKPQQRLSQFIKFFVLENFYSLSNIELVYKNQKPYLSNSHIYFNISHKNNMIFMVVSDSDVGIDAEDYNSRKRNVHGIAGKYFSTIECEVLCSSTQLYQDFYTLWTLKESEVKRSSLGIAGGFKDATFHKSEYNSWVSNNYPKDFYSFFYKDFVISLCGTNIEEETHIKIFKITNLLEFQEVNL